MSSPKIPITGRQIEAARALLNLGQAELAAGVGLTRQALARIEAGKVVPRQSTLARIVTELEHRGVEFINGRGVVLKKTGEAEPALSESERLSQRS